MEMGSCNSLSCESDILSDKLSLRCIPWISSGTYWGGWSITIIDPFEHVMGFKGVACFCRSTQPALKLLAEMRKNRVTPNVLGTLRWWLNCWWHGINSCWNAWLMGTSGHFVGWWLIGTWLIFDGWCVALSPLYFPITIHIFLKWFNVISFGKEAQKMEVSKNKVHALPLPRQTYDYALGSCKSRKKWVRGLRWMFRIYVDGTAADFCPAFDLRRTSSTC